ncbi:MAG: hypothetical protein M5U25_07145 [Planctomycetota bacterium]|nr:hypothetical protein [Planctomycetota bacterium]
MTITQAPHEADQLDVPIDGSGAEGSVKVRITPRVNPTQPSSKRVIEALQARYVQMLRDQNREILKQVKRNEARSPDGPKRLYRPEAMQD